MAVENQGRNTVVKHPGQSDPLDRCALAMLVHFKPDAWALDCCALFFCFLSYNITLLRLKPHISAKEKHPDVTPSGLSAFVRVFGLLMLYIVLVLVRHLLRPTR